MCCRCKKIVGSYIFSSLNGVATQSANLEKRAQIFQVWNFQPVLIFLTIIMLVPPKFFNFLFHYAMIPV